MPSSYGKFSIQLAREVEQFGADAGRVITQVGLEAWKRAVDATPSPPSDPPPAYQRTGRLSNGWRINTGKGDGLIPAMGQYPDANTRQPNFNFDFKKDRGFRIYNNIPYAYYVEHGLGGTGRSPVHMLKKATEHFESRIASEFNKLK